MMARIGKALANRPGRTVNTEDLEQRVEAIEAVVDGIVKRVDALEFKAEHEAAERRDGQ